MALGIGAYLQMLLLPLLLKYFSCFLLLLLQVVALGVRSLPADAA